MPWGVGDLYRLLRYLRSPDEHADLRRCVRYHLRSGYAELRDPVLLAGSGQRVQRAQQRPCLGLHHRTLHRPACYSRQPLACRCCHGRVHQRRPELVWRAPLPWGVGDLYRLLRYLQSPDDHTDLRRCVQYHLRSGDTGLRDPLLLAGGGQRAQRPQRRPNLGLHHRALYIHAYYPPRSRTCR